LRPEKMLPSLGAVGLSYAISNRGARKYRRVDIVALQQVNDRIRAMFLTSRETT